MKCFVAIIVLALNCSNVYAGMYLNKDLGIKLEIPKNARLVKGIAPLSLLSDEKASLEVVFEEGSDVWAETSMHELFTIGFYSGPIERGPDASVVVSAIKDKSDIYSYTEELIRPDEKTSEFMSFRFYEIKKIISISNNSFVVSKGNLDIRDNGKVTLTMPIYHFVTRIEPYLVVFSLSGEQAKVDRLEEMLLGMELVK